MRRPSETLALLLGLCACSPTAGGPAGGAGSPARPNEAPAAPSPVQSHGWPVLAGLTHLCSGTVRSPQGAEILWDRYTATEAPAQVVALYQARLGATGFEAQPNGGLWRAPNAERPERVLSVDAAQGALPDCPAAPAGARTVVELSEIHGTL